MMATAGTADNAGAGLWLRRGALLVLATVLVWQVVVRHMADYHAQRALGGERAAADLALQWDATQPRALELKARYLVREAGPEPDGQARQRAQLWLQRAVAADPARGNNLSTLALLAQPGDPAEGAALAAVADRLAPVQPRNQRFLAQYALNGDDLAAAVSHLARAMVGAPETQATVFPLLVQVAADPAAREVLAAIAEDPQPFPWWNGFFAHVANNGENLDALRGLVQLREASGAYPLQEYERNLYVNRLRREGLVAEAYLHWVNGLGKTRLAVLGFLYDGGFEQDFDNDAGFGWVARPPANSGIRITRSNTYGTGGERALRLALGGKRVRFAHLYQHVFLDAGRYTVRGRVRPEQLKGRRGLQWRVYCTAGSGALLGQSELFLGTGDWRAFDFEIDVPPDCGGQILRLYSAGSRDVDHELAGTIWFDDMQIELNK